MNLEVARNLLLCTVGSLRQPLALIYETIFKNTASILTLPQFSPRIRWKCLVSAIFHIIKDTINSFVQVIIVQSFKR